MKPRFLIILACSCLALSACVVQPYRGGGGYYYSGYGYSDSPDYGRRVWRD